MGHHGDSTKPATSAARMTRAGGSRHGYHVQGRPRRLSPWLSVVLVLLGLQVISASASRDVLQCLQVAQPVLSPTGVTLGSTASDGATTADTASGSGRRAPCDVLIMDHVFAFSYGRPFIGNYTPPSCEFNRVIMNLTVVSQGRQFDRLAVMYLGDTEIWRTSTAEPTSPPGIRWTYMKDMTQYLSLWKSKQTVIFDLGNLVNEKYTGSFNATLTATFFPSSARTDTAAPADLIIPISARKGAFKSPSAFVLPTDNATNTVALPQNANRAVFSISACGQASEEFWWSNVPDSDVYTFNRTAGALPGHSPFREVQVLIDGQLAGVWWPYPVIFTGGVVPSLHRPIVGLEAFDLHEHEIDISPWLPILCDGTEHTFTIVVAGIQNGKNGSLALAHPVSDNWVVTGKVFVWLDDKGSITTGERPLIDFTGPTITLSRAVTQNSTGFNETLDFSVKVQRQISIKATINSQGKTGEASWAQTLAYTNVAQVTNFGSNQINRFLIKGLDTATGPSTFYRADYSYPLFCDSRDTVDAVHGNRTLNAHLAQGLELQVQGNSVFPDGLEAFANSARAEVPNFSGSLLNTSRDGTAWFFLTGDGGNSSGYGSTAQVFYFGGFPQGGSRGSTPDVVELYSRNVTAVNGTIVHDSERAAGVGSIDFTALSSQESATGGSQALFAQAPLEGTGPRAFMHPSEVMNEDTSREAFAGDDDIHGGSTASGQPPLRRNGRSSW
ncbi:hypothetical protein JX266_003924 [Neoarthrinium moseri]|nr:hypothetical protein JX266_003924 [Neoarthrinium moseri]